MKQIMKLKPTGFPGMIIADDFPYITSASNLDSFYKYYFYIKNGTVQKIEKNISYKFI